MTKATNTKRHDEIRFADVFNNLERYPTIADVAQELGISYQTVRNKAVMLRKRHEAGESVPQLINRMKDARGLNPMSEDERRFMEHWTADDCIAELRRIAEKDKERVVTRNYFRNESKISESTWNRYFGTFEEFKRQAGLKLSRQQHAMERKIAIHASVDHYRKMGAERMGYADKYIREFPGKFKTILFGTDLHDIECDPFWLRVFIDTAKRIQPDVIILNGDVFDLAEFGKYTVDPRTWDVVGRIKFVHENILRPLRAACPNVQIDFIEGNHEARMLRQLADATPAMRAVLSDLHGWTVSKLLGLDEFEVNYIARCDLAAWNKADIKEELQKNYKVYWDAFIAHHFPHARTMGMPGANGHHHSHEMWTYYNPLFGTYEWHQVGSGHRRSAEYCEGERWSNGFLIQHINIETRSAASEYINITDFAVVGGKFYYRSEEEGGGNVSIWPGR